MDEEQKALAWQAAVTGESIRYFSPSIQFAESIPADAIQTKANTKQWAIHFYFRPGRSGTYLTRPCRSG